MKKMAIALSLVAMFAVTSSAFGDIVTISLTGTTAQAPDQQVEVSGGGLQYVETPMITKSAFNGQPGQTVELTFEINSDLFPGGAMFYPASFETVSLEIDDTSLSMAGVSNFFGMFNFYTGSFSTNPMGDIDGQNISFSLGVSTLNPVWPQNAGILDTIGVYGASDMNDFSDQFEDDSTGGQFTPQHRTVVNWSSLVVTPEPATMALLGFGGLLVLRRRR